MCVRASSENAGAAMKHLAVSLSSNHHMFWSMIWLIFPLQRVSLRNCSLQITSYIISYMTAAAAASGAIRQLHRLALKSVKLLSSACNSLCMRAQYFNTEWYFTRRTMHISIFLEDVSFIIRLAQKNTRRHNVFWNLDSSFGCLF